MCDVCSDLLTILENFEERSQHGGFHMDKKEILSFVLYVCLWPQRQCMCCFKDYRNFEKLNTMVQDTLSVGIRLIQTLPEDNEKELAEREKDTTGDKAAAEDKEEKKASENGAEDEKTEKDKETESEKQDDKEKDVWTIEEKEKLLQFVTKVFLMNFPSYIAYKHIVHSSLEELSQQETSALNNYCEISDPEVPLFLLRNVCYFCDTNGIGSLKICFEKATPETLPFNFAHILITLIANLRLWMNIPTVMQYIVPLRTAVIRYMCKLSDKDLRMAGNRNMTDLMWAAVKEPLETHFTFDRDGLELAFKYFTCSTLTIRLAGIAQLNNQITLYNESCNNETLMDAEREGRQLADWLIDSKIIEHIFGPNLHVELIKQSQIILNFLAVEGRITSEHVDCIWAAAQLKHCGKQVFESLIPLIKNMELQPVQHLLQLVSSLDIAAHTESTLYLASALIKCVWNTWAVQPKASLPQNQNYSAAKHEHMDTDKQKHDLSSSESIQVSEDGDRDRRKVQRPGTPEELDRSVESSGESPVKRKVVHKHRHIKKSEGHESEDGESIVDSEGDVHSEEEEESGAEQCGCGHEHGVRGHHAHHVRAHRHHLHELHQEDESGDSESEIETSDSSEGLNLEGLDMETLRQRAIEMHKKGHHHKHHHHIEGESSEEIDPEDEEEEELDSEFLDSEDEELLKQRKIKQFLEAHNLHENSEEDSEYDEDEDEEEYEHHVLRHAHAFRNHQLAMHRKKHLAMQQRKQKMMAKKDGEERGQTGNIPTVVKETAEGKVQEKVEGNNSGQESDTAAVAASLLEENEGKVKRGHSDTEVYDCTHIAETAHKKQHRRARGYRGDEIMSPDDGSCHSSHLSNKSEKNMADFDGEDLLSDDELSQINAHSQLNSHAHFGHLSSMASMYHTHMPHVMSQRQAQKESSTYTTSTASSCSEFNFEDVCKPGNTLLWDLVQDDKAHLLPDGLAVDAEKVLHSLVCFCTDRRIKKKFIEACINNLAHHKSVVVSLRLLPKIIYSFQQYRSDSNCHVITQWAERELDMMSHFFVNLVHYKDYHREYGTPNTALYSHKEEIQVRLVFLSGVFSSTCSTDNFRLNLDQVDTLWACLANDKDCCDEWLSWMLNQAKSKDHHALGLETFKHIFLEKMPQLSPKSTSMIGLNLFQQLSHLSRIANASSDCSLPEDKISGMDQLWEIALRALNADVSITAIQYVNGYYIGFGNGLLEKEEEFVQRCMDSLVRATDNVHEDPDTSLMVIQRGLVLMKNHLELFRKRYAFHLRNWQISGNGIISHQRSLVDKQSAQIRILLQPAGLGEKTQIEMSSTDLVAELRAEVTHWWEQLQKQQIQAGQQREASGLGSSLLTPILGAMLGDGPIRMITQGQELTCEIDEKTLSEMTFKEGQIVFVSVGAGRQPRKMDGSIPCASLPIPPRDKLPMMLLNQEPFFGQLLTMLEKLSRLDLATLIMESQEKLNQTTKATVLSRKVWELLMLLPTNSDVLQGFRSITQAKVPSMTPNWQKLLDPQGPHRLMYSLQIVEGLSRGPKHRRKSTAHRGGGDSFRTSTESEMSVDEEQAPEELWSKKFIEKKGLSHMFSIFMSGSLQMKEDEAWSQWDQECLAFLLRLITQFSIDASDIEAGHDDVFETYESPRKKLKKQKQQDKIIIPRLDQSIISMLNVGDVLQILMRILYDAAMPVDSNQIHAGTWGRTEVVHYSLSFLVSWAFSSEKVKDCLCSSPNFESWLKRLTMEAPEPHVRREACAGLYRLCFGRTAEGKTGYPFLLPILASLLSFLPDALKIKPQKRLDDEGSPKEKEPYGPGCRDYFWLVCRFVESISKTDANVESDSPVNLNTLARDLSQHVLNREFFETRHGYEEDDALIGLYNIATAVFKHNPPYKNTDECREFLGEVFQCLFALPSPTKRYFPKCKSQASRSGAYDLLVELVKGNLDNYKILHAKMLHQHTKDTHAAYPWDYWPHEDGRSKCGYVGLTNLGATCYMATCMQHLYMIPQARQSVLQAKCSIQTKHENTLMELQKMFAYLQESERKAYNPRGFCKAYTMDKQPLNTGEQKDMTEFFTDLITKLEEMSLDMKKLIKTLFGGVITNNVVSLDCQHVSRTLEEFYTVRCQVTDMKNLYESLDEVTVKDMLEGDNMYTCSKCGKKVRAEKRACFKKLPKIICFNTMRYTFNMLTMMKEKVNTHFSFPLRLDMSPYMEKNLISSDKLQQDEDDDNGFIERDTGVPDDEHYEYELIGVTVHTGTADGGHYYSFIRDRLNKSESGQDKWFLFNDAEVKQFDPTQIATECFGGEMTSKTYDSVTEKFMDFSFEKTNSAYMLFYEKCLPSMKEKVPDEEKLGEPVKKFNFELSKELEQWIWQDNMQFLQDKNIIEHTYFDFMMQVCSYIPTTLPKTDPLLVALKSSQLSTSFVLETFIHAKEKPTMVQWIELLTKQFNSCQAACEWFLDHMAESDWWPQQILIKCPNQITRQMFQRLLIHVINRLKPTQIELYLQPFIENEDGEIDTVQLGNKSCVTRFIKKMLSILEHGVRPHSKYLMEYFAFLYDFAKMGDTECMFLIHTSSISTMVNFYMGQKAQENYVEILSDDEEEEEVITIPDDTYKPLSLEKMIALISLLVEKSRSAEDNQLQISDKDYNCIIAGNKGYPFLFNQIRDNINVRQTCNLIFSLCRWNDGLASAIVNMVFGAIKKLSPEQSQPFFKLMSMLVEFVGGPPGMPPFTQLILQRFWELAMCNPVACLDWMANQVTRNKLANHYMLNQMDSWVEHYLIKNNNARVRNSAGALVVSLVPSTHFRQMYRTSRSVLSPHKEIPMSNEALMVLHKVYEHLLNLLSRCRLYVDPQTQGTTKLICYFTVLQFCLVSKQEKLMFGHHFNDLWALFQPKLSEPQISMHHNKQALLLFWYQACVDCPENVKLIVTNSHVCKHIPFTYILADHEDQDVMMFNRMTLPAYYGLLRMCCQQSRIFTRQLAQHQNILWAFKNITPYPAQYPGAVDELFKMMRLMATKYQDCSEEEIKAINSFRRNTIQLYLQNLDARSGWQTLIGALKILVDTETDRLIVLFNKGLQMLGEAFITLHVMYHEATACHVTGDIVDLLSILLQVLKNARNYVEQKKGPQSNDVKLYVHSWDEKVTIAKKLLTLLNSYTPPEIRTVCIDVLKEMILTYQSECINAIVPSLTQAHLSYQDTSMPLANGPYFPRRGQKPIGPKSNIRPPRPHFNMLLHTSQIEATKGVDEVYDAALQDFFIPYHSMVDLMCRVAVNQQILTEPIITFSAMVAYEGVPLHSPYFAKLWYEIYHTEVDKNFIKILCTSSFFIDYVDAVLMDERLSLNNQNIYQFFCNFFPKVSDQVLSEQGRPLLDSLVASITAEKSALENMKSERELMAIFQRISGDLRAMLLIFSVQPPKHLNKMLYESLQYILHVCREHQQQRAEQMSSARARQQRRRNSSQESQDSGVSEESGETPSKRRKMSSDSNKEGGSDSVRTESNTETKSKDNKDSEKPETDGTESSKTENKTEGKKRQSSGKSDSEPDIKECLGSPRPVTRQESPEPGPSSSNKSQETSHQGQDQEEAGTSSQQRQQRRESQDEPQRPRPRDRPMWVDMVAKHIESLFSLLSKSDSDS